MTKLVGIVLWCTMLAGIFRVAGHHDYLLEALTPKPAPAHAVRLTWRKTRDAGLVYYRVYRAGQMNGPYHAIADHVKILAYTDTSVGSGATYAYVVAAVWIDQTTCSKGEPQFCVSEYSNEVEATIP